MRSSTCRSANSSWRGSRKGEAKRRRTIILVLKPIGCRSMSTSRRARQSRRPWLLIADIAQELPEKGREFLRRPAVRTLEPRGGHRLASVLCALRAAMDFFSGKDISASHNPKHAPGHVARSADFILTFLWGQSPKRTEQRPPRAGRFTRLEARNVQNAGSPLSPHEAGKIAGHARSHAVSILDRVQTGPIATRASQLKFVGRCH